MKNILNRSITTFCLLFLFVNSSKAQQTFCMNSNTAGALKDLVQTYDGGYALCGATTPSAGTIDCNVIKTDPYGNVLWTRLLGGAGIDQCVSIIQSSDKGLVIAGRTTSFGSGLGDFYLFKLDSVGNVLWTRTVGGADDDNANSIVQTFDGGYVIAGSTKSFGAGMYDNYIIKLDALGNLLWTRTVGGAGNESNLLSGASIVQSLDSGYVVVGSTNSFDTQTYDFYINKLNKNGVLMWTKTVGGPSIEEPEAIVRTPDGGYAIAGRSDSYGVFNYYLMKLNANGNLLWTKTADIGGTEICYDMVSTADKGFALIGRSQFPNGGYYDGGLVKLDSIGNIQWSRQIGSNGASITEEPQAIIQTQDGGFAIAGGTRDFTVGPVAMSAYFVKLDASGNGCCVLSSPEATMSTGGVHNLTGGSSGTGGTTNSGGTSSNFGSLQSICVTTSVYELITSGEMNLFPNPFSDQAVFQTEDYLQNASLEFENYLGQTVKQISNISGKTILITRNNLVSGLYLLHLKQEGKTLSTKKIIIVD